MSGCAKVADSSAGKRALQAGEDATLYVQRLLLTNQSLAREFSKQDISSWFKPNGTESPSDEEYQKFAKTGFAEFRLKIGGLVEHPFDASLADLRAMPARTQITRHDCVEGWSCIGQWTGVPLSELLQRAGLKPQARYVLFHCFDQMDPNGLDASNSNYYETIDLTDAFHPQTLLAYDMNGAAVPVAHGAPLRLRVERQLGYKMAKYVKAIEVVDNFENLRGGRGGYWEDLGYDWYAGS